MTDELSAESKAIIDSVETQIYPPINPAVLLQAARDLYLAHEPHRRIVNLLAWTLYVITMQVPNETTPDQKSAITALHFARKMPRADTHE